MSADWVAVYATDQIFKAELLKERLMEENIPSVSLNKNDPFLGTDQVELFVPPDFAIRSIHIIKKTEI